MDPVLPQRLEASIMLKHNAWMLRKKKANAIAQCAININCSYMYLFASQYDLLLFHHRYVTAQFKT